MRLKKWLFTSVLFFSISIIAQTSILNFKALTDSLKQNDNFSEYIYIHLDEFKNQPTVNNLSLFKTLEANLWKQPSNKNEATALLYYYINYAYYLKQLGFISESVINYEKAYNCYKKHSILNYDIIEYCLKPLANNYTRLGDVKRAEDVLKITIDRAQKEKKTNQVIAGYSNLAIVLRTKGELETANNYLETGLKLSSTNQQKSRLYSNMAINYLLLNDYENVKKYIALSKTLNHENELEITLKNETTLGSYYLKQYKFKEALSYFEKALLSAEKVYGKNNREVAKIMHQIAEVYIAQKQYNKALSWFQKSLITLLPKFHPKNVNENPKSTFFYSENTLKEALDGRAKIFLQLNNFENALANYELAFLIEDELRFSYISQEAKLLQQKENRARSEKCIELCIKLFEETNNIKWIEKAFLLAEKTKAIVLAENKESTLAKSNIKSDTLFLTEKSLLFKKAQLNKSIVLEELKGKNANVNLLSQLTSERDSVFNKLQLIKNQIYNKYPAIETQSKDDFSVQQLQQVLLKQNEQLIEFFDGENQVYVFVISKNNPISFYVIAKDEVFKNHLHQFLSFFSDGRGTKLQNNIKNYTFLGHLLFKNLFKTSLNKNITIVPDGLLSFIPFDALLTENTHIINFEKLPYAINLYNINYSYSAKIALHNAKIAKNETNQILGFFPVFENNYRGLTSLNYTLEEAKTIKKTIKGSFFIGAEATKTNFLKNNTKHSIIHLSTHALAGDNYTPPAIEFYDETLYLPEIYGYNLNTDLLVLSACETGIGTLSKGEGVLSLARGFSYAGVKNLIVSLWKVNDKATEKLMTDFYTFYSKTNNKSIALHQTKLNYLKNNKIASLKKSPYYWASFVYFGETIASPKNNTKALWYIALVIIMVAAYIVLKKR